VAENQYQYFLKIQIKSHYSNSTEKHKFYFDIQKMKDYELTSETFDVLFKEFTVIDFLEDDPIQYDWDGFYRKMPLARSWN
jgi:hypothetical protein